MKPSSQKVSDTTLETAKSLSCSESQAQESDSYWQAKSSLTQSSLTKSSLSGSKKKSAEKSSHQHLSHTHEHIHSEESLRKIVNRLSRLEGHIRGIKTLVKENRACPDVLVQVAAVRGGLDKVARIILDEHLSQCMTRAAREGDIVTEIDALKAALDRFI